jgi:nitroimidazol reductase NimA-like FMN-containing flavoprotein (pyridoxamine 5'-phosphate oxidase superfamily)
MGDLNMTRAEIDAYLRESGRFAAIASLRKNGSPFVIPMGYYYDGEYLYFSSTPRRSFAQRLRRDLRVCVCVFDHDAIHGYVIVRGDAEEIEDPGDGYSLAMHHRYPKPGLENSGEHDRIWLSETRVVFRVSVAGAFGMDQRKATNVWQLAMPDVPRPVVWEGPGEGELRHRQGNRRAARRQSPISRIIYLASWLRWSH